MRLASVGLTLVTAVVGACQPQTDRPAEARRLIVYNAGSLARPMRAALDSFAHARGVTIEQESAGSLETARKLTELGKIPDVIALADHEVFPQLLVPEQMTWYALFARNRMVVAYTDRSKFAAEMSPTRWWEILSRPGVEVGRSDPSLDPNGYRTLLVLQLAERFHQRPELARTLLANAPPRNVRPKEADLVGLLQGGEFDYIWSYESLARAAGLRFVQLPHQIDLGSPEDSAFYAGASVRVLGRASGDSLTFRGAPIVYALSIPTRAAHADVAEDFVVWLLTEPGRRVLRSANLDALERPTVVGTAAPPRVAALFP